MPVYEYQCQGCGYQFEATQRIADGKLVDCPTCKEPKLERLISATSFQLKGSGWYKDGYGDKKAKVSTENDRADRLTKAIEKDKTKTEAATGSSEPAATTPSTPTPTPTPSGGGGGSGGTSGSDKSQAA